MNLAERLRRRQLTDCRNKEELNTELSHDSNEIPPNPESLLISQDPPLKIKPQEGPPVEAFSRLHSLVKGEQKHSSPLTKGRIQGESMGIVSSSLLAAPKAAQDSLEDSLNRIRKLQIRKSVQSATTHGYAGPPGGIVKETLAGTVLYFANHFDTSGAPASFVQKESMAYFSQWLCLIKREAIDCEPGRIVFLDTETTGLAGGTGTYAFLVGVGGWNPSGFCVEQYFMRDFHEEKALLSALQERLSQAEVLVTFNGKTFDVPLLQSRFIMCRLRWPLSNAIHLDLLHPARGLWKLRLGDCSLGNLEKQLLGVQRENDVPGHLIPRLYFNYTRTGNPYGIEGILRHNRQDIKSLADLTARVNEILFGSFQEELTPEELFSVGRYFMRHGQKQLSQSWNEAALKKELTPELKQNALRIQAEGFKLQNKYEQAVELWKLLIAESLSLPEDACENLAICYEHRLKDFSKALEWTDYALNEIKLDTSRAGWVRRRERLLRKLGEEDSQGLF